MRREKRKLFDLNQRGIGKILETLGIFPRNKINVSQILRERFIEGLTQTEVGDLFTLSQNRISEIQKILGVSETDKISISQI